VLDRNVLKCPMFFGVEYIYIFLYFSVLESVFLICYIFQNTTKILSFLPNLNNYYLLKIDLPFKLASINLVSFLFVLEINIF